MNARIRPPRRGPSCPSDPPRTQYWSTLSGYVALAVVALSLFKIVTRTRRVGDLWNLCSAVLPFMLFSATVEFKMGRRRKMAIFLVITSVFSLLAMRLAKGATATRLLMREVPSNQLTRCCASALLAFLARAAAHPIPLYYTDGIVVQKTFRWHGLDVDYSQAVIMNVVGQVIAQDWAGLAGSATGAGMQEIMQWLSH